MSGPPYRLGLPAWAFPGWRGTYFPTGRSMLSSYSTVLNAVEGNTTFYSIPDAATVETWRKTVAGSDMRMCFKLPRTVTHERQMNAADLTSFLTAIEPLSDNLGPLLVQFPATVGPGEFAAIDDLLAQLPRKQRAVIEVRHPGLFEKAELLNPLLDRYNLGRVVLDSRPLFEGDRSHPEVLAALHAKPDLPVQPIVHNDLALTRLILHPDLQSNESYILEWAERTAEFIADGTDSYMMIHCPNNLHCPTLARTFHETLQQQPGMGDLPALREWPVPQQASLL